MKCVLHDIKNKVLPRLELGSLDSESRVLTITPQGARVDEIRTQFEMIDFRENMPDIPYASIFGTTSKIC